jgi:chromosome segregation ATPase
LGNELHDKLNAKYNKLITQVENELSEVTKMMDVLEKSANSNLDAEENLQKDVTELLNNLSNRVLKLESERKTLKIYEKEISKLKEGSIALMEQITTVSKMRIYKPKNSSDLLYGIKFSDGAMDKINERLKELYIYSK